MKQRLQAILTKENLASSKFADIIGVNRSSISHLLSGRNNPSLEVLQKVLVKFPHINPDWLLLGEGNMYRNQNSSDKPSDIKVPNELFSDESKPKSEQEVTNSEKIPQNNRFRGIKNTEAKSIPKVEEEIEETPQKLPDKNTSNEVKEKKAVKIVFFYDDHTFDTFYPNQ